jgi:hypothetical protein
MLPVGVAFIAPCLAAAPTSNTFNVNGRVVKLTDDELAQVRKSWGGKLSLQTVLPLDQAQWALDFVAIMEANPPMPCTKLALVSTTQLKGKQDRVDGKVIRAGRFDELWSITSCGRVKRYRVLNPRGTRELQVYEVTNPKF